MDLEGCLSSRCRSLIFFLQEADADCTLLSCISQRNFTPMTWIPRALAVAQAMKLEGCLSSTSRLLMFFLHGAVADCSHFVMFFQRNLTLATQPSQVLIQSSRMILPLVELTTILLWWSLDILFPCESLHIRKNRIAPALGQNLTGHRMCIHSVLSTCCTLMCNLPFFVVGITLELP